MRQITVLFSFCLVLAACESKVTESSPGAISLRGTSLSDRLEQKAKIDVRIADIKGRVKRIQKMIELFKKVRRPNSGEDVYTPLDLALDINEELSNELPSEKDRKLVRKGSIELTLKSLAPECRTIETLLESDDVKENGTEVVIGERLTYSLRTCGTEGQFLPAFEAVWFQDRLEFSQNRETLQTIFKKMVTSNMSLVSVCEFGHGGNVDLSRIVCSNLDVEISPSERALIKTVQFSQTDKVRLSADADIFENQVLKAKFSLEITRDGTIRANLDKVVTGP